MELNSEAAKIIFLPQFKHWKVREFCNPKHLVIYFVSQQPLHTIYSYTGFPSQRCKIIGYNSGHMSSTNQRRWISQLIKNDWHLLSVFCLCQTWDTGLFNTHFFNTSHKRNWLKTSKDCLKLSKFNVCC